MHSFSVRVCLGSSFLYLRIQALHVGIQGGSYGYRHWPFSRLWVQSERARIFLHPSHSVFLESGALISASTPLRSCSGCRTLAGSITAGSGFLLIG